VLAGAAVAMLSGSCAPFTKADAARFCAIMPDSVGLYMGNSVTQMGYRIGEITSITPSTNGVRVDFTVTGRHLLPAEVKAVTRSTSILADRSLELVGNYDSGPQLRPGTCIPLGRSATPKSLSEIIGSTTKFLTSINPAGSTNVADSVSGIDRALSNNGSGINRLLTTSSAVLEAPEQAIGDIGSVITNLAQLTATLSEAKGPLKKVLLDAQQTTPDVALAVTAGDKLFIGEIPLITMISDIEEKLGPHETQQTLDVAEYALRKLSAHATLFASLLKPFPVLINWFERHANNKQFFTFRWRPPLYRIRTPDGLLTCGFMNASAPGSCADVAGTPYTVDVDLLQYVLTQASRR
jgi:phospholipid/cholesterol/gamma-HCH transport system substrate-binding protein